MDDVDHKIVTILKKNGRMPVVDIARAVDLSEKAVSRRIESMESEGVIRGYTIRLGSKGIRALVVVKVDTNVETARVADEVCRWDGVEAVWEVTGDEDIIVVVEAPDMTALNSLIDRIRRLERTQSTTTRLILREVSPK